MRKFLLQKKKKKKKKKKNENENELLNKKVFKMIIVLEN